MERHARDRGGSTRPLAAASAAAAACLALCADAVACPRCYTSELVRARALGPELWPNLLAISSPFLVMAAVVLVCLRIGAPRRPRRREQP